MLLYRYLIIYVIFTILFIFLVYKKIKLIDIYAFLIPFFGIFFDIGLRITASQVVLLLLNILLIPAIFSNKSIIVNRLNKYTTLFLVYIFLSAIFISAFDIRYIATDNPGFLRNEGRYISQIINFSLSFSVFIVLPTHIKNYNQLYRALRFFLIGIIVLGLFGLFQEIVFVVTSIDIFPIPGAEDSIRAAMSFDYFGFNMIRICSLAGEPKSFGMYLALGYNIIFVANRVGITFFKYDKYLKYFLIILLIITLSTSGFVLFGILYFVSFLIFQFYRKGHRINYSTIFSALVILFLIVFPVDSLDAIIEDRILGRDIANEDYDLTIREFLQDNPKWIWFGSGLGNIHNLAAPYIPDEFSHYMTDTIFVAKSGYLRLISETGIVGFALFLLFNFYIIYSKFKFYKHYKDNVTLMFCILGILALISYLVRGNYLIEAYLFLLSLTTIVNPLQIINRIKK